jgi:hypothetical protein
VHLRRKNEYKINSQLQPRDHENYLLALYLQDAVCGKGLCRLTTNVDQHLLCVFGQLKAQTRTSFHMKYCN